jgi:hypothetical protein
LGRAIGSKPRSPESGENIVSIDASRKHSNFYRSNIAQQRSSYFLHRIDPHRCETDNEAKSNLPVACPIAWRSKDTDMSSTEAASLRATQSTTASPTPAVSEDWLSVAIGLLVFALALAGLAGADLLGWVVSTSVWTDPGTALAPVAKAYASLGGAGAFVVTYLALLALLSAGAVALKADVP